MDVSTLLTRARHGDSSARGELIQATYDELHRMATSRMRQERPDHTLSATALVHEVSVKLLEHDAVPAETQGQFLALAAHAMRNLLVDHARGRGRLKRGGGRTKLSLDEALIACQDQSGDLVDLHEALESLARLDTRKAQVVELRYFGGLSVAESSEALGISPATVKRDWEVARAWLLDALTSEETPEPTDRHHRHG
ncbi:MAG: ECF-type sigma factor [Planctomycetota bacterium]